MLKLSDTEAFIFDVDDTLLDNGPDETGAGLHEHSRMAAARAMGGRYHNQMLRDMTLADHAEDFLTSPVHTVHGAVWQTMVRVGLIAPGEIDPDHLLVLEMVALKEELHEDILRTRGREVPGAINFVGSLHTHGFAGRLAVASTANRRDIDVFFGMTNAARFFDGNIISRSDFTHPKPNREAYDRAFALLGLPDTARRQVAAFEDDPRGIESAVRAGLYVCAIATRFSPDELMGLDVPPDVVATSYAEYADMLGLPRPLPLAPKQP